MTCVNFVIVVIIVMVLKYFSYEHLGVLLDVIDRLVREIEYTESCEIMSNVIIRQPVDTTKLVEVQIPIQKQSRRK